MGNPLFSLSEVVQKAKQNQPNTQDKAEIHRFKFLNKHLTKVESLKALNGRLPTAGEIFFLWTLNSFNAFTFIVYVIKHCGVIEELNLSTYSINDRILTSLIKWYDKGEILKINISIADSIKHRMPRIYDQLSAQAKNRNINVSFNWNHSKITAMRTAEDYFVVEGSGNFSENAQHEQYIFLNDKNVYDFRTACICPS
ncbi:MAG: hypothetical protein H7296_07465 [Bacteroidia bacterium]|nr:hypothetical protein [Bacteroidia bacterium]